jgi:autotransporter translocation and assembly factor TamB
VRPRPWYRLSANDQTGQTGQTGPTFFTTLHAEGSITANHLELRSAAANQLSANHVSADVSLDAGKLKLSDLRGEFLGGKHRGDWQADFSAKPAVYTGSGTVTGIALRQLASAMHDEWIGGTASGDYEIAASGPDSSDFWNSAEGIVQFDVRDGAIPHLLLVNDGDPLKIDRLQGRAHLQEGRIEIKEARLDSPAGKFQVSGTALLTRELDLKFTSKPDATGGAKTYAVGGTVAEPRVAPVSSPETQAQLK